MTSNDKPPAAVTIVYGAFSVIIGMGQLLISFMALASVVFVDLLGSGLTVASSAMASVPDKPYVVPYPRALALTIAAAGLVFAIAAIVSGCVCLYRRQVSLYGFMTCAGLCALLATFHFTQSFGELAILYLIGFLIYLSMVLIAAALRSTAFSLPSLPARVPEKVP
jgi:hypothetical protein